MAMFWNENFSEVPNPYAHVDSSTTSPSQFYQEAITQIKQEREEHHITQQLVGFLDQKLPMHQTIKFEPGEGNNNYAMTSYNSANFREDIASTSQTYEDSFFSEKLPAAYQSKIEPQVNLKTEEKDFLNNPATFHNMANFHADVSSQTQEIVSFYYEKSLLRQENNAITSYEKERLEQIPELYVDKSPFVTGHQPEREKFQELSKQLSCEEAFFCQVCGAKFQLLHNLQLHMFVHTAENSDCSTRFHQNIDSNESFSHCSLKFKLQMKILSHLSSEDKTPFHTSISSVNSQSVEQRSVFNDIPQNFKKNSEFYKEHSELTNKSCKEGLGEQISAFVSQSPLNETRHEQTGEPQPQEHSQQNCGDKSFSCEFCHRHLKSRQSLLGHLVCHSDERPYWCNVCPAKFKRSGGLRTHLLVHSEEKPHACPHCPSKFKRPDHLRNHVRTHAKEMFSCPLCSARFKSTNSVETHMRVHSNETSEKTLADNTSK